MHHRHVCPSNYLSHHRPLAPPHPHCAKKGARAHPETKTAGQQRERASEREREAEQGAEEGGQRAQHMVAEMHSCRGRGQQGNEGSRRARRRASEPQSAEGGCCRQSAEPRVLRSGWAHHSIGWFFGACVF